MCVVILNSLRVYVLKIYDYFLERISKIDDNINQTMLTQLDNFLNSQYFKVN